MNAINEQIRFSILSNNQKQQPEVFLKKVFLKISQSSLEKTRARFSFLIKLHTEACSFTKEEIRAQVFSCKFCEPAILWKKRLLGIFRELCEIFMGTFYKTHRSDCFWIIIQVFVKI